MVVTKVLQHTQEEKLTSPRLRAKSDLLPGVSAFPAKSILQTIGSRRSATCEGAREERSNLGNYTSTVTRHSKSECSVVRATRKLCRFCPQESTGLANAKGTYVQACEKFFRPPNKTAQEKVVTSRSECEHENQEFIVDSGASLHTMRRSSLVKKVPSEDGKKPPASRPPMERQGRRKKRQYTSTMWTFLSQ